MKRATAAIVFVLALLVATPASAYVLVLKNGARVDVGEAYRMDGSRLAYISAGGAMHIIYLADVDLQATARENGETVAEFIDRASRPRRVAPPSAVAVAPASAPQPAVDNTPITVTNADLEPYRVERERLDAEYYKTHPKPPAYYPSETQAPVADEPSEDVIAQWRDQARQLRDQLDVEQSEIDALSEEIDIRQRNPLKYGLSYEYNFGRAPILVRRGGYYSSTNPLYGNLRADDEFAQINSRLVDLQIQHRATLAQWAIFEERARRAGIEPGVLRE
jgi:hypothetical protein